MDPNRPRKLSFLESFAIRDGVGGGVLACGCAYGRYVTYGGASLTVIDDAAAACPDGHERHMVIPFPPTPARKPDDLVFYSP